MKSTRRSAILTLCAIAATFAGALLPVDALAGPAETKVFLNGTPVPVYFNDGDSFRVLRGRMKDARARIAGFNTLESHGPVHVWGNWHVRELYNLATLATLHARRGVWTCTSDGKVDTYGRILVHCPDLAEDLVRLGLAHAMTVSDDPATPALLAAQREAIAHRRGIWAHGVPPFIVTSLHSAEEDIHGRGSYNRLVSSDDGHSVLWRHADRYRECQKICHVVYPVDEDRVARVCKELRADEQAAALISDLSDEALARVVRDFAAYRHVNRDVPRGQRAALQQLLGQYASRGSLGEAQAATGSCMIHVPFSRRYGAGKASCLRLK